ncbi:MAG: glycosyltransferase family 4 protein [Verrucomicrobia bacterium]|nr:glycosyltransferase family 4 protein [Verrucomicrobiota bacterium]
MRIAQIAPLAESVPPKLYGGTERVVSYLVEELVAQGHEVTLYASGDSETSAELVPLTDQALRLQGDKIREPLAHQVRALETVFRDADRHDVLHFHLDYLHFPVVRHERWRALTTMHGRLDLPDFALLLREYSDLSLVSISNSQREPVPWANWIGTVYHGLPKNLFRPNYEPSDHLVFLGRICPEKRADRAIEIALRTGLPLKIAAKVDNADREYFEAEIKPRLGHSLVEFAGEVDEPAKEQLLRQAKALLFPVDWPEPFGLVMIEALACGTPVIAFRHGSTPEVLTDGKTGFLVDTMDQAVGAVQRLGDISREACRAEFEERFSAARMATDYLGLYRSLLGNRPEGPKSGPVRPPAPRVRSGHFS